MNRGNLPIDKKKIKGYSSDIRSLNSLKREPVGLLDHWSFQLQTKGKVNQLSSWSCLIRSSDVTTQTFIPFIGFLLQEKVIKTEGEKKNENKHIEHQEKK